MSYFVTGATGFIGRFLLENLLKRQGTIYVLVRESSLGKIDELKHKVGDREGRIVPVVGDLTQPKLGISDNDMAQLKGKIKHFFHLAAIYDLSAPEDAQVKANIDGTRNAVKAAEAMAAGCFQHVSS